METADERDLSENLSRLSRRVVGGLGLEEDIYATRITPADTFGRFARETKSDPAWNYHEIDASHAPNVTAPEALMALLQKIAA